MKGETGQKQTGYMLQEQIMKVQLNPSVTKEYFVSCF